MYVIDYDIIPDTNEILTDKIQKSIDECSEKRETLFFKKGIYKTGTLLLRSNLKICLEKGAVILGSLNKEDYPDNDASFVDGVDQKRGQTLILAYECENFEIFGEGEINGNGRDIHGEGRPFLFRIVKSNNILLENISLKNSAAWCLHLNQSSHIVVKNISIDSRVNGNNDGIDIDASDNITIDGCNIKSGDDAICLKSISYKKCEHINVSNCKITSECGGIKIGTETVGDISDINITNCYLYDVMGGGIKITPTDGAKVCNVLISDITMTNCTGPIFIVLGERMRKYGDVFKSTYSTIKDITIKNINADVIKAPGRGIMYGEVWANAIGGIIISGTKKNLIENLVLENITGSFPGGVTEYIDNDTPYIGDQYPEFHRMDIVPAKGIYARDIKNLQLRNINISFKETDIRETVKFENVVNLSS